MHNNNGVNTTKFEQMYRLASCLSWVRVYAVFSFFVIQHHIRFWFVNESNEDGGKQMIFKMAWDRTEDGRDLNGDAVIKDNHGSLIIYIFHDSDNIVLMEVTDPKAHY